MPDEGAPGLVAEADDDGGGGQLSQSRPQTLLRLAPTVPKGKIRVEPDIRYFLPDAGYPDIFGPTLLEISIRFVITKKHDKITLNSLLHEKKTMNNVH